MVSKWSMGSGTIFLSKAIHMKTTRGRENEERKKDRRRIWIINRSVNDHSTKENEMNPRYY